MKKLILILVVIFANKFSFAQSQQYGQGMPNSENKFCLLSSKLPAFSYRSSLWDDSKMENLEQATNCMIPRSGLHSQLLSSPQSPSSGRRIQNPYKARNIGIGFLIGGTVNAGAGALLLINVEESGSNDEIAIFFGQVFGAGAIIVGGASFIGGTITTIVGTVRGYRATKNRLHFEGKGNSVGLAYSLKSY